MRPSRTFHIRAATALASCVNLAHRGTNRSVLRELRESGGVTTLGICQTRALASSTRPLSSIADYLDDEASIADDGNKRPIQYCPVGNRGRIVKVAVLAQDGSMTRKSVSMAELRRRTGLHLSELLMAETASIAVAPRILSRSNCIVFSMAHVRALILRDEVPLAGSALLCCLTGGLHFVFEEPADCAWVLRASVWRL